MSLPVQNISNETTVASFCSLRNFDSCFGLHPRSPFGALGVRSILFPGRAINFLTSSTETAKFKPSPPALKLFTPIRLLESLSRGPPELPGLMGDLYGSFESISTKIMRQGSVPWLSHAWLVACWMTTSPALRCTVLSSSIMSISPDMMMA